MENCVNHRQEIGKRGEDIACRYLQNLGHRILERNWRSGHLEIDIISVDADGIHFVEVKTRQKNIQAPPQDNVNQAKQKHIAKAASRYLNSTRNSFYKDLECCFDIVAITLGTGTAEIYVEWIPQAYIPLYI